jgi:methionyl-tRNA formyltransferase
LTEPVRVVLLGAPRAPLTAAALDVLERHAQVDLVAITTERVTVDELRDSRPDVVLSAAYRFLLREPLLAVATIGSVGLHPSLLPRYRGSFPLWWALRNGEAEVGLSLYMLTKGIDEGPVLGQARVAVAATDTFASLYERVASTTPSLLDPFLEAVASSRRLPPAQVQDERDAFVVRTPTKPQRAIMKARWTARRAVHPRRRTRTA